MGPRDRPSPVPASDATGRRLALDGHPRRLQPVLAALLRSRFFAHVSRSLLNSLLEQGWLLEVPAGTTLIREGSRDTDGIYFLLSGSLDVLVEDRFIVSLNEPGETIGELAFIRRTPRNADVRARTDATLVELSVRAITGLREPHPERYIELLELLALYLGEKLATTTRRMRTYEELVLETHQLRSHSEALERQMAEKLRQILLYSHVMQASADGVLIVDPRGGLLAANPAARALMGWPEQELPGGPVQERFAPLAPWRGAALPAEAFKQEWWMEATAHGTVPLEVSYTPVMQEGRLVAAALFLRDIREHKALLASLEQSRNELARYSEELEDLVAQRTRALQQANAELQASNGRLADESAALAQALHQLQETQSHLLQSEKMVAVGRLAGGMAHEINNPMGFITSNLHTLDDYLQQMQSLLHRYAELEPHAAGAEAERLRSAIGRCKAEMDYGFLTADAPELLRESLEGARRVVEIVANLKEFVHLDEAGRKRASVNEGLERALLLMASELRDRVTVERAFGEVPDIECRPQQLNQVFLNLLANAAEAVDAPGRIRLRTALCGERVVVEIADSGRGIPPETLPRIFEPFFTTRPVGRGTGLGLTSAYQIVRSHGGRIEVDSEPGRGTTFTIILPVSPAQPQATGEAASHERSAV